MDLADGLTLSSSQEKKLESAITILAGIGAWEYQSTQKFDANVPLISKQRFGDAIAQTFGRNVATSLFPGTPIQGNGPTINPGKVLNQTMGAGIALLIADKIADEFFGSTYRKMDGLQAIVRGTGKGLTVGGIVGGLVDATYATGYGGMIPSAGGPYAFKSGPMFNGGQTIDRLNR
jgi:hypothetical protein